MPEWLPELNLGVDAHVQEDVEEINQYKQEYSFNQKFTEIPKDQN